MAADKNRPQQPTVLKSATYSAKQCCLGGGGEEGMLKWKFNGSTTSCQQPQVLKLTVGSLMTNFIEEKKTVKVHSGNFWVKMGFRSPLKKLQNSF